jgi:hypothetical protein
MGARSTCGAQRRMELVGGVIAADHDGGGATGRRPFGPSSTEPVGRSTGSSASYRFDGQGQRILEENAPAGSAQKYARPIPQMLGRRFERVQRPLV